MFLSLFLTRGSLESHLPPAALPHLCMAGTLGYLSGAPARVTGCTLKPLSVGPLEPVFSLLGYKLDFSLLHSERNGPLDFLFLTRTNYFTLVLPRLRSIH